MSHSGTDNVVKVLNKRVCWRNWARPPHRGVCLWRANHSHDSCLLGPRGWPNVTSFSDTNSNHRKVPVLRIGFHLQNILNMKHQINIKQKGLRTSHTTDCKAYRCRDIYLFLFTSNRDALNLLKMSPVPKASPVMAAPAAQSPVPTPAASPPPPGSRPNIPPLSVPGKPGAPVSTHHTTFHTHTPQWALEEQTVSHRNSTRAGTWLKILFSIPWWCRWLQLLLRAMDVSPYLSCIFHRNRTIRELYPSS